MSFPAWSYRMLIKSPSCIRRGGEIFCVLHVDQGIRNSFRLASSAKVTKAAHSSDLSSDVSPQGVQGDDCSNFKLWQQNCARYGFSNCSEQLQSIQTGRKTLAEVLAEQEKLIADVAIAYREANKRGGEQGVQDSLSSLPDINSPCPQGIQGDDCARFKLWLENCHRFGVKDCVQQYSAFRSGRQTLAQIFAEQDKMIRDAVKMATQQRRKYSTSSNDRTNKAQASTEDSASPEAERSQAPEGGAGAAPGETAETQLTQRQKLQRAVKEYGSTVIVFHVTISLASLGFFYLLVSSGLDIAGFLLRLDIGGEMLKSKLAAGTGTFVLAYAVHKVFAPVRIATTLTATPFIVRYLRKYTQRVDINTVSHRKVG